MDVWPVATVSNRLPHCQDVRMRALIALDKFKGSYSAIEICAAVAELLNAQGIECAIAPMADGGEGTLDALQSANFAQIEISTNDALGNPHDAKYGLNGNHAVIELANTCGMQSIAGQDLDPWRSGTYGLGQAAIWAMGVIDPKDPQFPRVPDAANPPTITVAVGGSASVDGGLGFLQALGYEVKDQDGIDVTPDATGLVAAASITPPSHAQEYHRIQWRVLVDVDNPALGPEGAAHTFGPQKGFTQEDCIALEAALMNWTSLLAATFGKDQAQLASTPGAGAAGAITTALTAALNAKIVNGSQEIADAVFIDEYLDDYCDVVVIGEGRLDDQTPHGKAPSEIARRARAHDLKVFAFVGQDAASDATKETLGITATVSLEAHGQNVFAAANELASHIAALP